MFLQQQTSVFHKYFQIDGDADSEQVEREVKRAIYVETQNLVRRSYR